MPTKTQILPGSKRQPTAYRPEAECAKLREQLAGRVVEAARNHRVAFNSTPTGRILRDALAAYDAPIQAALPTASGKMLPTAYEMEMHRRNQPFWIQGRKSPVYIRESDGQQCAVAFSKTSSGDEAWFDLHVLSPVPVKHYCGFIGKHHVNDSGSYCQLPKGHAGSHYHHSGIHRP